MLTERETLTLEMKLKKNKMKGIKPNSKSDLAKFLGTTRQQIYYCCHTDGVNNSARVEELLRKFIKG